MAKIYGKPSTYLKDMALMNTIAAILYIIIGFFTVSAMIVKNPDALSNPLVFILLLVIYVPILVYIYYQYKEHDYGSASFLSGLHGEHNVGQVLKQALSFEYSIFSDVKIDHKFGNIDYVVIGPTGIFTLEVKNHKGNIAFNGDQLTKNGKPFEKDFLRQSMAEALSLHEYIFEQTGEDIFVRPTLVFSNFARMHFGLKEIKNVSVIQKRWLIWFLTEKNGHIINYNRSRVEHLLSNLVAKDDSVIKQENE